MLTLDFRLAGVGLLMGSALLPAHAGWAGGTGCFEDFEEANAAFCAYLNPDTTNPGVTYYRDSCVTTTIPNVFVQAHMVTHSNGAVSPFTYTTSLGSCSGKISDRLSGPVEPAAKPVIQRISAGKPIPAGEMCLKKQEDGSTTQAPIIPATGEKKYTESDYTGDGPQALNLVRYFRSTWATGASRGLASNPGLGFAWAHNHAVSLSLDGAPATVARVLFGDGRVSGFIRNSGTAAWKASTGSNTLTPVSGSPGSYFLTFAEDDSRWQFDASGRLVTQTRRNGWVTTYTYSTSATASTIAPVPGLLVTVNNQFGRSLNFVYNASSQLVSVTAGGGQATGYAYNNTTAAAQLTAVTYPGNAGGTVSKTYLYENTSFPRLVTGIVDENGNRLATAVYDSLGRATSSGYAGGADLYSVSYATAGAAVVTDPRGTVRTYHYGTARGKLAVTGADKPSGTGNSSAAGRVQDANGFVTQETDFLGVNTMYTWDINRRLPLTTTEATALPEARTTATQWHAAFSLPVLITEAGHTTAYTYDTAGNALSSTVTDTATSAARTTSWTYNGQGLLATESAPNSTVTRTYAYYTASSFSGTTPHEVGHTVGDLQSITNAAGHVTQFTLYDRAGRVRQMVDPKGVVTDTVYTSRGWVSSVAVTPPGSTARTTSYTYDNAGQLTGVVMPDATTLSYSYDAAHRLTGVTDAKGNSVTYTLDNMGNKVGEQVKDSSGNLQRNITRVYDALSRVQQVTGASN
jgi:YD repeat-containing protein